MSTTLSLYNNDKTYRNNRIRIAVDLLLNDFNFFSRQQQFETSDNFYVYDKSNGLYVLDAEMFIVHKLNELFPNCFKHYSHIREVINQVQRLSLIILPDQINPKNITNFKNGLFLHNENKLIPHSPRIYTTKQIPTNYIDNTNSLSKQAKFLEHLNYL
jgi:phage/plasmid-associated DNA primase